MPTILSLESIIGGGKTTFLNLLKEKYGSKLHIVKEPVDQWQDINGINLLDLFYKDQTKYSFLFQTYGLISRVKKLEQTLKTVEDDAIIIIERSWFTDINTFAQVLYDDGMISELEWSIYNEYFNWATRFTPKIDGYIYLIANVEVAINRIKKRDRSEESSIPREYLQQLFDKHNKWLLGNKDVILIDGNLEFETNESNFARMCTRIDSFLN